MVTADLYKQRVIICCMSFGVQLKRKRTKRTLTSHISGHIVRGKGGVEETSSGVNEEQMNGCVLSGAE